MNIFKMFRKGENEIRPFSFRWVVVIGIFVSLMVAAVLI